MGRTKPIITRAAPLPEAPAPDNTETAEQMDEAVQQQRKPKGRLATMLTGGLGVDDEDLKVARRTLLGG
jgi:hypothetical protein